MLNIELQMEDDVIIMLKAKKLAKLKEVEAIEESIQAYMRKMGYTEERIPLIDHNEVKTSQFPDYPMNEPLITKINFLYQRQKLPNWWRRGELENELIKQEGDRRSLGSMQNIIKELIESKLLIRIKYRNSNKLAFYTTDKSLLYSDANGKWFPILNSLPDEVQDWENNGDSPECTLNS